MKLELSIADDRKLRLFVKDLIKGEVRSIARGEIKSIIASVAEEKIIPKTPEELNKLVLEVIKEEVQNVLRSTRYGKPGKIVEITREIIQEELEEMWKVSRGPVV